jgi:hypothetical protein
VPRKIHILKVALAVSLALAIPSNASGATETITACGSSANQLTIPAAQTINITIEGAGGGGGDSASGGGGGLIELEYQASDDEILELYAGCGGVNSNGAGGAGYVAGSPGENTDGTTGGGGGSSAVLGGNNNKIASAGGGGGAGYGGGFIGIGAGAGGAGGGEGGGAGGTTDTPAGNAGSPIINQGTAINQQTGGGGGGGASGSDGSDGQVVVEYNIPPTVRSNKTFNGTDQNNLVEKEQYVSSDTLTVRSNVTDPDSELGEILLSIRDPTGDLTLDNASMSQIDTVNIDGDSGATFERDFNFPYIFLGDWSYTIWASDQPGLLNNSQGSFEMIDLTPPETRNTFQNRTLMTVHDTVLLQAEGYDNWNLSHAVLATNETGEWENKTGIYGSPKTPYTFQSWTTTGFEWKNDSMTGNKSVHWRIWYNDTSGQHSVTETNSFRVRENVNWNGTREPMIGYVRERPRNVANGRSLRQAVSVKSIENRLIDLERVRNTLIPVQENAVRSQVIKPEVAESMSAALNNNRLADGARNFMTGTAFNNPTARINDVGRIFSQAIAIDSDFLTYFEGARLRTEEFNLDEETVREQAVNRATPVSVAFSSNTFRTGFVNRALQETFTGREITFRSFTGDRDFSTEVRAEETASRNIFSSRSFSQTLTGATAVKSSFSGFRAVTDQTGISDTTFRSVSNLRTFTESVNFLENRYTGSNLARLFSQRIESSEVESRSILSLRSQTEDLVLGTEVERSSSVSRTVLDSTGFQTSILTSSILQRAFESSYSTAESTFSRFSGLRATADIYGLNTEQARETDNLRLTQLATGFSTQESQSSVLGRLTSAQIIQSSIAERTVFSTRNVQQLIDGTGEGFRSITGQRSVVESVTGEDSQYRTSENMRNLVSEVTADTVYPRSISNSRSLTQNLGYIQNLQTAFSGERNLRTSIEGQEEPESIRNQFRDQESILTGSAVSSRSLLNLRQFSTPISASVRVSRAFTGARNIVESVEALPETDQQILNLRSVTDIYTGEESTFSASLLDRTEVLTTSYSDENERSLTASRIRSPEIVTGIRNPRTSTLQRIFSDTITGRAGQNGARLQIRSIAEGIQATADPARSILNQRLVSQIFTADTERSAVSDILRQEQILISPVSDSGRQVFSSRSFIQNLGTGTFTASESSLSRAFSQSIGSTDQQITSSDITRAVSATVLTGLNPLRTASVARTENPEIGYIGVESEFVETLRTQLTSLSISGNQESSSALNRNFAQSISSGQIFSRALTVDRYQSSLISGQFLETRQTDSLRSITDSLTGSFQTRRDTLAGRTLESALGIETLTSRSSAQTRSVNTEAGIGISAVPSLNIARLIMDSTAVSTEFEGSPSTTRQVAEILGAGTDTATVSRISRIAPVDIQGGIVSSRFSSLIRDQVAEIGAVENANGFRAVSRSIQDSLDITGAFTQTGSLNRILSQEVSQDQNLATESIIERVRETSIGAESDPKSRSTISRAVTDSVTGSIFSFRTGIINREVAEEVDTRTFSFRNLLERRITFTDLEVSQNTVSTGSFSRLLIQNLQQEALISTQTITPRSVADAFSFRSDTNSDTNLLRTVTQGLNQDTALTALTDLSRTNTDTFSGSEKQVRNTGIGRTVISQTGLSTIQSSYSVIGRQVTDQTVFTAQRFGSAASGRIIPLSINAGLEEERSSFVSRALSQIVNLQENSDGSPSTGRMLVTQFAISGENSRDLSASRSVVSLVQNSFAVTDSDSLLRAVSESITSDSAPEITAGLNREILQSFEAGEERSTASALARATSQNIVSGLGTRSALITSRTVSTGLNTATAPEIYSNLLRFNSEQIALQDDTASNLIFQRYMTTAVESGSSFLQSSITLRSIEDIFTGSSSESRQLSGLRTFSQTFSQISELDRSLISGRAVSSSIGAENQLYRNILQWRATESTMIFSERSQASSDVYRTIRQGLSSENVFSTESFIQRSLDTALLASDQTGRQLITRVLEAQSLGINDNQLGNAVTLRTLTTSIQTLDSVFTAERVLSRTSEQNLASVTAISGDYSTLREVLLGVEADNSQNRGIISSRSVGSSVALDSVIQPQNLLERTLRVNTGFSEQFFRNSVSLRSLEALIGLETGSSRGTVTERLFITETGFQDSQQIQSAVSRLVENYISAEDGSQMSQIVDRTVQQFTGYGTDTSRRISVFTAVSQPIGTDINQAAVSNIRRVFTADTRFTAGFSSSSVLERIFTAGLTLEDQQNSESRISRTFSQIFLSESSTQPYISAERAVTQLLDLNSEAGSELSLGRLVSSGLELQNFQERGLINSRSTSVSTAYTSSFGSQRVVTGLVNEVFESSDSSDRQVLAGRAVTGSLGVQNSAFPSFDVFDAVVETAISAQGTTDRTVSVFRQVSDSFGIDWFFSSFMPGTEPEDPSDGDSDGGTGGSGGGGSIGGGGMLPGTDPVSQPELSFTGNRISVRLSPGESSTASVELENNGNGEAETQLEIRRNNLNTVKAISLQETDYLIEPGSSVQPSMNVTAPAYLEDRNISDRVLERTVYASAENSEAAIPVNVLIQSDRNELLDVRMNIEDNQIEEGQAADYSFEIFNLGETDRVDIELFTTVTNSTGHIIHEEKEELAVQTSTSVVRDLDIDLPPGRYRIKTRAKYGDKDASSFSTLRVEESEDSNFENILVALVIISLMMSSAILAVGGYRKLPLGSFIKSRTRSLKNGIERISNYKIDISSRDKQKDYSYTKRTGSDDLAKREWIPSSESRESSSKTGEKTTENSEGSSQDTDSKEPENNEGRPTVNISDIENKDEDGSKKDKIKDIHEGLDESLE